MPISNRIEKIQDLLLKTDSPKFYKKIILDGVYKKYIKSYDELTSLPKSFRQQLTSELGPQVLSLTKIQEVEGNQAQKVLLETEDKNRLEVVRMTFKSNLKRGNNHYSLCISSQSGCALGCQFCATGAIGFKKNLTADEISDQILYFLQNNLAIDSVAFMGMGESFANPNLFDALKIITGKETLGFSARKLSISTVGIIPGIKQLGQEFPEVNLAFSLHSPFPLQRQELMPIAKTYPTSEVMQALKEHIKLTNKKVFISYLLLAGVNDTAKHAAELIRLIKNQGEKTYLYHVNLIRYNFGTTKSAFQKASSKSTKDFQAALTAAGINHTLKERFGKNIAAACGQLYGGYAVNEPH